MCPPSFHAHVDARRADDDCTRRRTPGLNPDPRRPVTDTLRAMNSRRQLLAILANPPLRSSGDRTMRRVAAAAEILDCSTVIIGNMFSIPTVDVLGISMAGCQEEAWLESRRCIADRLETCHVALLAWGLTEPRGRALTYHRNQVAWVTALVRDSGLPAWSVGGAPRHPSRWQRYTSRVHPDLPFDDALAISLKKAL